tara:strand:- start:8063 stop:11983 length:3921 start_codon:yes stop_codon:yes gene_type:complete
MRDFDKVKLSLSSPKSIRERSYGEVTKAETINYRTLVPEKDGLFCEAIFGPVKDWSCSCGKYRRIRYKGIVCEKCGVEVTRSKVRRERMGHIELAVPVAHIWFYKGIPNNMSIILGVTPKDLESVIYFSKNIIIDPGNSPFSLHQIVEERECKIVESQNPEIKFKSGMGAEAILECLDNLDLESLKKELYKELEGIDSVQKKKKIMKRLELVKGLMFSGNKPSWMILQALPVMPADLRPMVQLDGGRFATADVNDLLRRVINRNKRLKKLKGMFAPEIILRNEKRMLQEAVDALLDNGRRDAPTISQGNRDLKSLSDMLKGKHGRFRQNLLGKRVDYSGRSVIVVGPDLKLNQCGLPKKMALELYKPFIMRGLVDRELVSNIKSAKRMVESEHDAVWKVAEEVIKDHPILLNRPPSLHRASIQAFDPVLIEGKALRLHPLVCAGFNADFDGDQLSVHLVLSPHSIMEARMIMLSENNLLSPASGRPMISPSREMLMGCYYVTGLRKGAKGDGKIFASLEEARIAYENDKIAVNAPIKVRIKGELVETTVGRIMFNDILPEDFRDYGKHYADKDFKSLISSLFKVHGITKTAHVVNKIKDFGFDFGTRAGITISIDDLHIPSTKKSIVEAADVEVGKIEEKYKQGQISSIERYREVLDVWNKSVEEVVKDLVKEVDDFNPVFMMSKSGARGGLTQMRQLSGMRGLVADTQGRTIEAPIRSNYREGLTVLEFFMSSYGARKGSADKALRTADSGYLTRRLVDIAHDVIVVSHDCGTKKGIKIRNIESEGQIIESFFERLVGRTICEDIVHEGEVLAKRGSLINEETAKWIVSKGVQEAFVRSPMTCESKRGICAKCYGMDLSTQKEVSLGEAAGVIAAQSIGEPGTQLTMRTFHTGGVSERDSAVSEILSASSGEVAFIDVHFVTNSDGENIITNGSKIEIGGDIYALDIGSVLLVKEGDTLKEGDKIADINPYTFDYVTKVDGYLDFSDIVISERTDPRFGIKERVAIKSKIGESVPFINVKASKRGDVIARYPVASGSFLIGDDGSKVKIGDVIAKTVKEEKKSRKDITGGLPRVQQLLEARSMQYRAVIAEVDGVVKVHQESKKGMKIITIGDGEHNVEHLIPATDRIIVADNSEVKKGDKLTEGTIFVGDLLRVKGVVSAKSYIVDSVQQIYREQGVAINDKHVEIIVRQMFKKVRILNSGDSDLLEDEIVSLSKVEEANSALAKENKQLVEFEHVVQGLTKAAINTDSFISAASFQDTTKVLSNAAIRGSIDNLEGLKESVIIGRRIPAGTGLDYYRNVEIDL